MAASREAPPILRSAELKKPGNLNPAENLRFGVQIGPQKMDEAKPKMAGAVPTNRYEPIPVDFGPISGCCGPDPPRLVGPGSVWRDGVEDL